MTDETADGSQDACHLLRLSDEVVLKIFNLLPVKARLNAACLHSRIRNIAEESWKHVHYFPSQKVGFRFHKDKKRLVFLEEYLDLIVRCKNVTVLRIPSPVRSHTFWREAGRQIGSYCPRLQRVVGQFNDIEFVVGIADSSPDTQLTEVSVREIGTVQDVDKLLRIVDQCDKLRTCRILINSIPNAILRCADVRLKLIRLNQRLQSIIAPQSLSIHFADV